LNAIGVLTLGVANLDFKLVSGGSCVTGTAYTAGQACTVNYRFDPQHPGTRLGAITLTDSARIVLAMVYLTGIGTGSQAVFANTTTGIHLPIAQSIVDSGFRCPEGVAVDGSGNVSVADTDNGAVKELMGGRLCHRQHALQRV
jgi:hypothetical protein